MSALNPEAGAPAVLPRAAWWAHAYNAINTLCWGIVTGVPMQLFLKDLHAAGTVIGVLVAIPSFTQLLQLWVGPLADRLGYRRFALFGWAWRIAIVLALVPLVLARDWLVEQGVPPVALVVAVLVLLVAFNALRTVSNSAFLPWYSVIIPEPVRGRFLARENIAGTLGGMGVALISWAFFLWNPPGVYALLFGIAALFGVLAIACVDRFPPPPPPLPREQVEKAQVSWRTLMTRPFTAQLTLNLLWALAMSASGVCWVGVLRDVGHCDASVPAILPMVGAWTALLLLPLVGRVVDHTGNRPALGVAAILASTHLALWALLAWGLLPFGWPALILIQTFAACGGALFGLASQRLLMSVVPAEQRGQGFAFHGVVCGVAGGLFPIAWGALFDFLTVHGWTRGEGYAILYGITAVIGFGVVLQVRRLPDPGAHRMRDFLRIVIHDVRDVLASLRPTRS